MPRIIASGREVAAGAFIVAALAGVLYLVYRALPWAQAQDVHLHAVLGQSYGLRDGSPVRMAGVTVGRVTSARVLAGGAARGKVRVDFFVRETLDGERLADLFPDAGPPAARLLPEGSLLPGGQTGLTIEPGAVGPIDAEGSRLLATVVEPESLAKTSADTLAAVRRAADAVMRVADGIDPPGADGRTLVDRLAAVAADLEAVVGRPAHDGVPPRDGTLAATIASADDFVKALRDPREGTVGRLVSSPEVHDKLVARLDHADAVLADVQRSAEAVAADARRLLDAATKLADRADRTGVASVVTGDAASGARLEATLASAQRTLAHLEAASARLPAAADAVTGAFEGGRRAAGTAEDVVSQTRRHWLLRGLFAEPADPWLRLYDLGDDAGDGE